MLLLLLTELHVIDSSCSQQRFYHHVTPVPSKYAPYHLINHDLRKPTWKFDFILSGTLSLSLPVARNGGVTDFWSVKKWGNVCWRRRRLQWTAGAEDAFRWNYSSHIGRRKWQLRSKDQLPKITKKTVERDWPLKILLSCCSIIYVPITSHLVLWESQALLRPQNGCYCFFAAENIPHW